MKAAHFAIAAALMAPTFAPAQDAEAPADRRTVSIAVQRDALGNQSAAAAARVPVGRTGWVQAGVGRSRSRDAAGATYRPHQVSLGGGVAGKTWQAGLTASLRRDGEQLCRTDLAAAVDWQPVDGVSVGVEGTHRRARAGGTVAGAAVEQRLSGQGVGLHGAVVVTPRLSLHGATLHSRYRSRSTQQATAASPGLQGLLGVLSGPRVSVVNRDEAALERSHQLGATYRVSERVALSGELTQDRVFEGGQLRSLQLKAAIAAGDSGWTLTPGIGRSRDAQGQGVSFGSVGASLAW
ncbi:hypothetical protein ACG02S_10170 [Roseateles sp. DC23W]|uniref:Autotransporter domain-containing protein n=1 Tax=Pelomonas dachongensis TaxID=3299029 RepID=A0ABW7ELI7_9BURK